MDKLGWAVNEAHGWAKFFINNTIAFIARILPAKHKAINVQDVANAMKIEFELRLNGKINKTTFYHSDDMRELIQQSAN